MKLKKWEIALMLALVITVLFGTGLSKVQGDLSEKLIRLHVVANSDSDEDQTLKLAVRDRILEDVAELLEGVTDRDEAVQLIDAQMETVVNGARDIVISQGYTYQVTADVTVEEFPSRDYDTFSLPAGKYTSLRVIIGAGNGHNWWCVIFPPLCLSTATDFANNPGELTEEQIKLITSDEPAYILKFKSVELFEKLRQIFGWY